MKIFKESKKTPKKSLEEKLKNAFRDNQIKNFLISFKRKDNLATMLSLENYESFIKDLTDDEFYEFILNFERYGQTKILFSVISGYTWFDRCCSNPRLIDNFSNYYVEHILTYGWSDISKLFFTQGQNERRQLRIFNCLTEMGIDHWISNFIIDDFIQLNKFLVFVSHVENPSDGYGYMPDIDMSRMVFENISSISDLSIAKLLENSDALVIKRILKQLHLKNRDIFIIYKNMQKAHLYDVIVKSNFDILNDANSEIYSWLYSNLLLEDFKKFLSYLSIEKLNDLRFFNEKICAEVFDLLDEKYKKEAFLTEVYLKKGLDGFFNFYKSSSTSKKEEILEFLFKDENEEKLKIAKFLLLDREDLSFFEKGIKNLLL